MKFKEFLTEKNISEDAFSEMTPKEMAELHNEYADKRYSELEEKLKTADKSEELETLKAELAKSQKEVGELNEKVIENGLEMNKIKESGDAAKVETLEQALKSHFEKIEDVMKSDWNKVTNFTVKANVLASTAITDSTIAMRDTTLSPLAYRNLTMYNLFRKVQVGADNGGIVRYIDWDTATTARAAAMVAEGAIFPESTAAWQEYSIALKKVGDTIPLSEEMAFDHARFAGELENFLRVNVELVIDDELLNGTGLTTHLTGLDTYAPTFTAVASGITDASFYDLVPVVAADITFGKGSKFQPNVIILNLKEANKFKLKKDANNNYIMPPFASASGAMIDGLSVVINNNVADDVAYIGDSRYGTIYEAAEGYSITVGEVDDQFTKDLKTLKARKRMAFLIKESEKAAWRKIDGIAADLVTLAS